MNQGIIVIFR